MIRKIIAKLLGWKCIWIQHHDGETFYRLVQPTPFGLKGYSHSRVFGIGGFICLPDGTCRGASYVRSWKL